MQKTLLALLMIVATSLARADDQPVAPGTEPIPRADGRAPNDAVGVSLAPGLRGTAAVGLETIYNSNFFLQSDNPRSSYGFVLTPGLLFLREAKKIKYQIGIDAETAKYTGIEQGPDNYLDARLRANFSWNAETRHRFFGDAITKYGHDPFGSFRTENGVNVSQGLDKWLETSGHLGYRFGAPGALINLESELGLRARRYKTNRDATDILDYRQLIARETAFLNVSSKTSLLAEVLHLNNGYYAEAPGFPGRDSQETHYRAGFHWMATGTTSGDIRVGKYRRNYDNPFVPQTNATDWTASLNWAPLVYSVFTLQSGVQAERSYLPGVQLIENRFEAVDWTHDWSYSFRTRAAYTHVNSEFVGSARVDNIDTVALEANYLASQRWMWSAGTSYSHRGSNETGREYNDNLIYLGLRYAR